MADIYSGTWVTGRKAPTAEQTNPNNDPEIAASQARLRALADFDFGKATPTLGKWKVSWGSSGEGETPTWVREVAYDTPGGRLVGYQSADAQSVNGIVYGQPPEAAPLANQLRLQSAEKYWWKPGLAEDFTAGIGEDGRLTQIKPRDTSQSFGEQLAEFAGSIVALGATGLAAYGIAAGLGAAAGGTGAGAGAGGAGSGAGAGGFGLSEAAQLALAAGSIYSATQMPESGQSTSVDPGDPTIEGPTPPPAPPVIEYQDFVQEFELANKKATRNKTNLNPGGITNALHASGNLLLGA